MSIRGTRTFPPAGIEGDQGATGPAGSGIYSIGAYTEGSTVIADPTTIELVASFPTSGTIRFWGNVNLTVTDPGEVKVTPVIDGNLITDFRCTVTYLANKFASIPIAGIYTITAGNNFGFQIDLVGGTGTMANCCILYSVE